MFFSAMVVLLSLLTIFSPARWELILPTCLLAVAIEIIGPSWGFVLSIARPPDKRPPNEGGTDSLGLILRPSVVHRGDAGEPICTPITSPDTTSSTRRFRWRPAAVSFESTGCVFPNPLAEREFIAIPCWVR